MELIDTVLLYFYMHLLDYIYDIYDFNLIRTNEQYKEFIFMQYQKIYS